MRSISWMDCNCSFVLGQSTLQEWTIAAAYKRRNDGWVLIRFMLVIWLLWNEWNAHLLDRLSSSVNQLLQLIKNSPLFFLLSSLPLLSSHFLPPPFQLWREIYSSFCIFSSSFSFASSSLSTMMGNCRGGPPLTLLCMWTCKLSIFYLAQ